MVRSNLCSLPIPYHELSALLQFFNASKQPLSSDHKTKVISWQAFPKNVRSSASSQRAAYKKADSTRSVQVSQKPDTGAHIVLIDMS